MSTGTKGLQGQNVYGTKGLLGKKRLQKRLLGKKVYWAKKVYWVKMQKNIKMFFYIYFKIYYKYINNKIYIKQ